MTTISKYFLRSFSLPILTFLLLLNVPLTAEAQLDSQPEITFTYLEKSFDENATVESHSVSNGNVEWSCTILFDIPQLPGFQTVFDVKINGVSQGTVTLTEGVAHEFTGSAPLTANGSTLEVDEAGRSGKAFYHGTWSWNSNNPLPVTNGQPPVAPCVKASYGGGGTCPNPKFNFVCSPNEDINSFGWRKHFSLMGSSSSGCNSCGGTSSPGSSGNDNLIYVGQTFIPSNQASIGNSSPGVYFNFDQRTEYYTFGTDKVATFFSPIDGRVFFYRFDATKSGYVQLIDDNGTDLESSAYYGLMTLEDSTGNPVTNPNTIATQTVYSFVTGQDGWTYKSELVDVDPGTAVAPVSRLVEVTSPTGKVQTFTYKYNAGDPALVGAPKKILMIDKITDWQGNTATFTYNANQQAGRWVVSDIDIVAQGHSGTVSRSLRYTYNSNGHLHQVFQDFSGTEVTAATYTYGTDTQWQAATIVMDEQYEAVPMAQTLYVAQDYRTWENSLVNQFSNAFIGAADGAGVRHLTVYRDPNNPGNYRVLENGNLTEWEAGVSLIACSTYTTGSGQGYDNFTNIQYESTYPEYLDSTGNNPPTSAQVLLGQPEMVADGTLTSAVEPTFDAKGNVSRIDYADTSYEVWQYNSDNQETYYRDREGIVTLTEYNSNGQIIRIVRGLVDVSGPGTEVADVNTTAVQDIYGYNVDGQLEWEATNAYAAGAVVAPAANVRTDYVYKSNKQLEKVLRPLAPGQSSRPETQYVWEGENLVSMTVVRDTTNETTSYDYDSRNRLVKTTFPDGTTEQIGYTTNGLTTYRKDRSNIVSATTRDAAGRVTTVDRTLAYDTDLTDANIDGTPASIFERLSDQVSTTTYFYSAGETQPNKTITDGKTTEYVYDYKDRLIETIQYTGHRGGVEQAQVSRTEYKSNMKFSEESLFGTVNSGTFTSAYGRKIYYGYSANGATVRTVQVASSGTTLADNTAVMNASRPSSTAANPSMLITDAIRDLSGNIISLINPLNTTQLTAFDTLGRSLSVKPDSVNFPNYVSESEYDVWGNSTKSTDPAGVETTSQFDASGQYQISQIFGANDSSKSAKTEFTYDRSGRRNSVIAPGTNGLPDSNRTTTTFYDASCCGQTIGTRDALGHGQVRSSDPSGRVVHTAQIEDYDTHTSLLDPTDAKTNSEVTTRYLDDGKVQFRTHWTQALDENINRNLPQLAGLGKPASWGVTTQYVYDLEVGDGAGLETATGVSVVQLSTSQNVNVSIAAAITKLGESVANGGANTSLATHHGSATLVISADEKTMQASISDAAGRPVMSALLSGPAASSPNQLLDWSCTQYDLVYNLTGVGDLEQVKQIDSDGKFVSQLSDGYKWGLGSVDQNGNVTQNEFNPGGQPLKVTNALSNDTTYVYDSMGRQTSMTTPAATTSTSFSATTGQVTSRTDGKGESTQYQYDALGRLSITTDRMNKQTSQTYHRTGQLASVTDAQNKTTSYDYDVLNRRIELELDAIGSSNPQKTTYGYDSAGRLELVTLHSGAKRELSYEFSGVLDKVDYFAPAAVTPASTDDFTYDNQLRRTSSTSSDGVTHTYAYTDRGQMDTDTTNYSGQNYVVDYDYDSRGRLSKITYPSGRYVDYTFTNRGELNLVKWNGSLIENRGYDPLGRLTSIDRPQVDETRGYDNANRVTSIANTTLGTATYTYDANSNKLGETFTGPLASWSSTMENSGAASWPGGYDKEDRFRWFRRPSQGETNGLVRTNIGNINNHLFNGVGTARTFNDVHQLTDIGSDSQSFDLDGQLTTSYTGMTLDWQDGSGRLAETVVPTGAPAGIAGTNEYGYDADNKRLWKKITRSGSVAEHTVYIYAGPNCIAEYDAGTAQTSPDQEYVYGQGIDSLLMIVRNNGTHRLHVLRNQQWSVIGLQWQGSGNIAELYAYDVFGKRTILAPNGTTVRATSSFDNPYGYTCRRHDEESGLMYFRARYFDNETGEFVSQDPIEMVDGASIYRGYFVVGRVDPLGSQKAVVTGNIMEWDSDWWGWFYSPAGDLLGIPQPGEDDDHGDIFVILTAGQNNCEVEINLTQASTVDIPYKVGASHNSVKGKEVLCGTTNCLTRTKDGTLILEIKKVKGRCLKVSLLVQVAGPSAETSSGVNVGEEGAWTGYTGGVVYKSGGGVLSFVGELEVCPTKAGVPTITWVSEMESSGEGISPETAVDFGGGWGGGGHVYVPDIASEIRE